jgi:uncharacterized protein (DUF934 family)
MKFIDIQQDPWQISAGTSEPAATTATPATRTLFSLADWLSHRATWPQHLEAGVLLPNDAELEPLLQDLQRLTLVALQFPRWTDGRAYSQARLLRTRHHFKGQLRATGEVLVDMVPLLLRTGFDAAVLRADQNLQAAERALSFFNAHYQSDALAAEPIYSPARQARWARAGGDGAMV